MNNNRYEVYPAGAGYIGQDGAMYWTLEAVYNFNSNVVVIDSSSSVIAYEDRPQPI